MSPRTPAPSPTPATIPEILQRSAERHGSRRALTRPDGTGLSYAELLQQTNELHWALAQGGIGQQDRVAVALPNGLDVALALLGVCATATAVPLRAAAPREEQLRELVQMRATHLVTCAERVPGLAEAAQQLGVAAWHSEWRGDVFEVKPAWGPSDQQTFGTWSSRTRPWVVGGPIGTATRSTDDTGAERERLSPEHVAVVLPTSGSTGQPKRVPLTHRNLQVGAARVADALALTADDRALVLWEQHHIGGLVDLLLAPLCVGSEVVCGGGFSAARFYELLETRRPTWFQGVPATLRDIIRLGRAQSTLPIEACSLRLIRSVAAALPESLRVELEASFRVPVVQTFGMTEASPLITTQLLPPEVRVPGSVGVPWGCEVSIMDPDGARLPVNREGDIAIRGENVFDGYERDESDPEADNPGFRDGWFITGDRGRLDTSGRLFLTGRRREMINRGGETIAPAEIEHTLLQSDRIEEAAVFAIPHPTLGEDVAVAVVPTVGVSLTPGEVRAIARASLSDFKVPARVTIVPELPRSPVGKVLRSRLATLEQVAPPQPVAAPSEAGDPLERQVAELWRRYLDLDEIAPDADFRLLGGDSLAELRLRVDAERQFAVSLERASAEELRTIRSFAAFVRRQPIMATSPTAADAEPASASDVRQSLLQSRSRLEFRARLERLLNTHTKPELDAVLGPLSTWRSTIVRAWSRFAARRHFALINAALDLEQLRSRVRGSPTTGDWRRRAVAPGIHHYICAEGTDATGLDRVALEPRPLLIVWAGNQGRPLMPMWLFLAHLGDRHDVLLLADPERRHFAGGLPGVADDLKGLQRWISDFVRRYGYARTLSFGTSAGGLAAVWSGLELGSAEIAAVGADRLSSHPLLAQQLAATLARQRPLPDLCLGWDSRSTRDRDGAEELLRQLPGCRSFVVSDVGLHNVLFRAFEDGRLRSVLESLLPSLRAVPEGRDRRRC